MGEERGSGSLWSRAGRLAALGLALFCALILFAMMMLTVTDVVLRYIFSAPLRGAYELTELSLAMLIYAGLPLVSLRNQHVATDLIGGRLGEKALRLVGGAINTFCGLVLAGVSWVVWFKAQALQSTGDTTIVRGILLAPFVYMISVLILITAVIHLGKVAWPGQPMDKGGAL